MKKLITIIVFATAQFAAGQQNSATFYGIGFVLPNNSNDYYTIYGGSSLNLDFGRTHRNKLTNRFALGRTFHYSYYNYKLRDAHNEPDFKSLILNDRDFDRRDIQKQVFRSHNIAAGVFTRFILIPSQNSRSDGVYLDLGIQGDFAFSKYYKIKALMGKRKVRDQYAFNPFTASAFARIGGIGLWRSGSRQVFYARYRFTDTFNNKPLPIDLPPVTVGIQFTNLLNFSNK